MLDEIQLLRNQISPCQQVFYYSILTFTTLRNFLKIILNIECSTAKVNKLPHFQTILSAGAALPVLLAGTGIGLAAGVAGGTAAVTEKVMKSRQMSVAKLALVNFIVFSPLSETTVFVK